MPVMMKAPRTNRTIANKYIIKFPVLGSPLGVVSFVACLAQETMNHTSGPTKIRSPKSMNEKYFF
jgi:hypothetical protein